MRRVVALVLLLALTAGGREEASSGSEAPTPAGHRVLAVMYRGSGQIAELDALTLRPLRTANVGFPPAGVVARSPDGSTLAVASGNSADLRLVQRERFRASGSAIVLGRGGGHVEALAWPARRSLIALVVHSRPRVVAVDPWARRVTGVRELDGSVVAVRSSPRGLVVFLAPRGGIGPAGLLVAGAGGFRTLKLAGVHAGWNTGAVLRRIVPGLAVDPDGRHAVVVSGTDRAIEIDLETLTARSRELTRPASLLARLRDWLEPAAQAKSIDGPMREAIWVGRHHVAVSGVDVSGRNASPAGVRLIDTRDWSVRTLSKHASAVAASGLTLLAFGGGWTADRLHSIGLHGFDAFGRKRFHVFGARHISSIATAGRYGYVTGGSSMRFEVVDLRFGRVTRVARTPATTVVIGPG